MRLIGAQQFIRAFINPNTPYSRILIKWQTGTGKSIAAIAMAAEYIRVFRAATPGEAAPGEVAPSEASPSVFVISFTARETIQEDMLRHPELGFVSAAEVEELRRYRAMAQAAGPASVAARQLSGYIGGLRRRITDRSRGGYYQFYGYKEFANRLFEITPAGFAAKFDIADIPAGAEFGEKLTAAGRAGLVRVNTALLDSMRKGFLIADEIHETYNITAENNYGIAIQYALDVLGDDAPRAVFISATPTTGSAAEIVDLLNLLVPRSELPGGAPLRRADFFVRAARPRAAAGPRLATRETVDDFGAVEVLGDIDAADATEAPDATHLTELNSVDAEFQGVLNDDDLAEDDSEFVITQMLPGALERIRNLAAGRVSFLLDADVGAYPRRIFDGDSVPGVPYLKLTLCPMTALHQRTLDSDGDGGAGLAPAAYALNDMVYPNPDDPETGLYRSGEVAARLMSASDEWRRDAGVHVERGLSNGQPPGVAVIGGDFLSLSGGLSRYSAKYERGIKDIIAEIRAGPGKILIFHPRVRLSGVLAIQELLRINGIADSAESPTDATLCGRCGIARAAHTQAHPYTPARFTVAHSIIDRAEMVRNIALFNAPSNVDGAQIRVLIGSKIIRQSLNFKAVRYEKIFSMPTDYPTLLQIFGRVARRESHAELPPDQRDVRISIYVSTRADGKPTPELQRYMVKGREYAENIQRVDRVLHECAVDGFANWGRIRAALGWQDAAPTDNLDALAYEPLVPATPPRRMKTTTFDAYGYGEREVAACMAVCAVLFRARPVWTYPDLLAAARSGVVAGAGYDGSQLDEGNFALALERLQRRGEPRVAWASPYYIAAPASSRQASSRQSSSRQAAPDIESYLALPNAQQPAPVSVDVVAYSRSAQAGQHFAVKLQEYAQRYLAADAPADPALGLVEFGAEFHYAMCARLITESANLTKEDEKAAAVYRRFKITVDAATAAKVPAAAPAIVIGMAPKTPVGYITADAAVLYDRAANRWFNVGLADLGIGRRVAENNIVVGFVVSAGASAKFKIRPSIAQIAAAGAREGTRGLDIRTLSRGGVCETRPREELEQYVAALDRGRPDRGKAAASVGTTANLCERLRLALLAREAAARAESMTASPRWLYLFNERPPNPAALRL